MGQKSMKKLYNKILTTLLLTALYSCVTNHKICVKTIETDSLSKEVIYDGGHNEIFLDTIINGNHIYQEVLRTEEYSDRLIVYNPRRNHMWCNTFKNEDCFRAYKIEDLNIRENSITIKFFNDSTAILGLEILEDYDYKGHCLLIPRHKEIPLFKSQKAITKIDYIINDTIKEDYPLISIAEIVDSMALINAQYPMQTKKGTTGWINKKYLGIYHIPEDTIIIHDQPSHESIISSYIIDSYWGKYYYVLDASNKWLKIIDPNNPNVIGWLAPEFQSDNPYTPPC